MVRVNFGWLGLLLCVSNSGFKGGFLEYDPWNIKICFSVFLRKTSLMIIQFSFKEKYCCRQKCEASRNSGNGCVQGG